MEPAYHKLPPSLSQCDGIDMCVVQYYSNVESHKNTMVQITKYFQIFTKITVHSGLHS